jgi:hypothetical protein
MLRRVRVIDLNTEGAAQPGLLIIEIGVELIFRLRPTPRIDFSSCALWTNAPKDAGTPFRRVAFSPLEGGIPQPCVTGDWEASLVVVHPGCFEFFLEFAPRRDGTETALTPASRGAGQPRGSAGGSAFSSAHSLGNWESGEEGVGGAAGGSGGSCAGAPREAAPPPSRGPLGRFVVQPQLSVRLSRPLGAPCGEEADPLLPALSAPRGPCEELVFPLAPEGLTLQTQLTRCLGPIDGWLRYAPLAEALREAGCGGDGFGVGDAPGGEGARRVVSGTLAEPLAQKFNMLHFSPPQRLGGSRSCYSLKEQLCLDWDLFAGNGVVEAAVRRACDEVGVSRLPHAAAAAAAAAAAGDAEARLWAHPFVEGAKSAVLARMLHTLETQHGVLCVARCARGKRPRCVLAPKPSPTTLHPPSLPSRQRHGGRGAESHQRGLLLAAPPPRGRLLPPQLRPPPRGF